jgi:hypothetical protein
VARLAAIIGAVALAGCEAPHSQEAVEQEQPQDLSRIVKTVELKSSHEAEKLEGVATILSPDPLLQIDGDIRSAKVAEDFSSGQLVRFRRATMLSQQMVAKAEQQAALDAAHLKLLQSRLRQTWGDDAPFLNEEARQKLIAEISAGKKAIVRFDFPNLTGGEPLNPRVVPLHGGAATAVETLWSAPTGNQAMPGVSFFGIIPAGPGLRAGDRARLIADNPDSHPGVVIPNSAIVVYASQSWCYVETGKGKYERMPVVLDYPVDGGYLARTGFEPGMRVVVRGASVLLSREAEPGDYDDDDDGGGSADARTTAPMPRASASIQTGRAETRRSDPD